MFTAIAGRRGQRCESRALTPRECSASAYDICAVAGLLPDQAAIADKMGITIGRSTAAITDGCCTTTTPTFASIGVAATEAHCSAAIAKHQKLAATVRLRHVATPAAM